MNTENALLTADEVCKTINFSRAYLNKIRHQDPTFPKPVQVPLASQKLRWRKLDILNWIDNLKTIEA